MAQGTLESFLRMSIRGMASMAAHDRRSHAIGSRIRKTFHKRQVAEMIGVGLSTLSRHEKESASWPGGAVVGRERVYTLEEIMTMRAILAASPKPRVEPLAWRGPGDPLPVVSFASQKGGTGKSLSAAHFAQYLSLTYGMRVGLIDADPQHTLSLYFASPEQRDGVPYRDYETLVDFTGLFMDPETGAPLSHRPPEELDGCWVETPWPGIRLIPANIETSEGEIQLARLMQARVQDPPLYMHTRRAIDRWSAAYPPRTDPATLADANGTVDADRFASALTETLDVIVIDYQPALTIFQLNNLVASTHLVIPQTMKGFDIATLEAFLVKLLDYVEDVLSTNTALSIGSGEHVILPTIVQRSNDTDLEQIGAMMEACPGAVSPVFYLRSDAVANAADLYQSAYEFEPSAGQRRGLKRFIDNANAVNDALVAKIWPGLERGYAQSWMDENYGEEDA